MSDGNVDISDIPLMITTTKNLIKEMEAIDRETRKIKNDLKVLGESFNDEGYQTIQNLIEENTKLIEKNRPEFNKVTTAMTRYIDLLIQAKEATKR